MGSRRRRVLAVGAAAVAALALLALAILHTPPARARVLTWATSQLLARFDLVLTAERLSYNLATRSVTLTDVTLAARHAPERPFLIATRINAGFPLAAYVGRFALDEVAIEQARVVIETAEDGSSNLPASEAGPPPQSPRRLPLSGLHVRDLSVVYDDRAAPLHIDARGIEAALDDQAVRPFNGASGPFAIRDGVTIQWGERTLRVEPFESRIAFDGQAVSMQDLPLVTNLGRLNAAGRLDRVLDNIALEISFDGEVDVARAAAWAPPPIPVAGTARVTGTLTGQPSALETVVRFDATGLTAGTEADLTASGELLIDRSRLTANRLTLRPRSGGEVTAALQVPFGEGAMSLSAAWQGVDARALMRVANVAMQPVATRLDGRAEFVSGPRRSLTLQTDLASIADPAATSLAGRLEAGIAGDAWSLTHDLRTDGISVKGRAQGAVNEADFTRSSLEGSSALTIASLGAADRALTPFGVRIPEALRSSAGAIDLDATLGGTLAAPAAKIDARSTSLDLPGIGPSSVTALIQAGPSAVVISPFSLQRVGARVDGALTLDLSARTLDGRARATVDDAQAVLSTVADNVPVEGTLDAEAVFGGTFDEPRIDVTLNSPAVIIAGDRFESLAGRLRVTDTGIDIASLELGQDDGGRLRAEGRYGFDRSYTAALEATALSWSGLLVGDAISRVTTSGTFEGTGTLDRPMGSGTFDLGITGGLAGDLVGEGTVRLDLDGEVARVTANVPSLRTSANATVGLAAPYDYRGTAVVDAMDLAQLTPLVSATPGQLTGQVTGTAAFLGAASGNTPPQVQANLQSLDAALAGVPVRLVSPATIAWTPDDLEVRAFTAIVGSGGTLTAEGRRAQRAGATYSGSFHGDMGEVLTAARAFGIEPDVTTSGWIEATVYGTGDLRDLIASFDITGGTVKAGDRVSVTNLATSAGISGETLTLHSISGRVDAAEAGGTFSGKGRATVPGLDPLQATGSVQLDSATFDAAGVEVRQSRPSTIAVDRGVVKLDDVVWEALGSEVGFAGSVDLSSGTPAFDLTVDGIAALRVLSAFLSGVAVDGTADVDLRVGGTSVAPELSGSATLVNAEVALSNPRIVVSELSGRIELRSNRIELRGITGSANGGRLTIDGGAQLEGLTPTDGEINVQAAGMAVEYPRGLRSEIDAQLTYAINGAAPLLRGDVRVVRSAYTEPISLAALARANRASTVQPPGGGSALDDLRLDVAVTTVEDLRVDNNYGRFEGGAQLRLVGTAARPGMSGQVTLREGGRVYAAGRTFTLSRGTIAFTDLNRIQPDLDIQAVTRASNLGAVTLTVQGTPDKFEFDLTSDENASQEEIATALLGGGATSANALALLSSDLLGVTGRQIGLDALRIDRGDVVQDEFREDPSATAQDQTNIVTRLTLTRRLRDNVEFTLSQNLAENGKTTFIVSYYPLTNLELRLVSRDDGTQAVGVRHQITFGGDARPAVAAPREVVTVSEVRLEGALAPFTEDELRPTLRVAAAKPFDYFDWQRDLDGLTARYVERGFFEARVRGRREDLSPGTIRVVYTVAPGPATRIVVDGFDVPPADLQAIRQAWTRGVFDRFIVDDARGQIQRALLARGYVNGVVDGAMDVAGDAKTLRLSVIPGTQASGRTMRFAGNVGVHNNELEAAVLQWGMAEYGWIDRDLLARSLEEYYRGEGYLTAEVSVDSPAAEGDAVVLPVRIDEGTRATIREVRWSGVSAAHEAETARAANVKAGEPYTLASVNGVRERVDRHYRTLGYNAAEVGANALPVNDNTHVDITLEVTEGPQQILQDVETIGATRTREGVVRRALRLPVGQPANLEEWSRARKRLFDTNVFRSVDIQAVPLGDPVDGVQQVRARVMVAEYPPWRLRYGVQVDREPGDGGENDPIDFNLGVIGEIRNQNLFGRALTGGASTRLERDYQRGSVFAQTASFFTLPARSGVIVYASRDYERGDAQLLFVTDEFGASVEQRWRRTRGVEITYAYNLESHHTYDPEPIPGDPFPLDQRLRIGRVQTAFLYDRRDDPISAAFGTFSSVSVERAASWLASEVDYGKLLGQQYAFWTVGPVVLAARAIGGHAFGAGLPLDDRFRAGGATSVRGYPENGLGPRDLFGDPRGGTDLLVLNQEVRFPLYRWFSGVAFVDAGNVFDQLHPFAWRDLKVGYGLGLRLNSPIGLLRLDYGIEGSTLETSTRRANDFTSGRWYFGLGHIF